MHSVYAVEKIPNPIPGRTIHKWRVTRDGHQIRTYRTRREALGHLRALGLCPKCSAPWQHGEPTCRCERVEAL